MPMMPFSPNSPLLIPDEPICFLPTLGAVIGVNEAIFLQKIQDELAYSQIFEDGRKWVRTTMDEIHMDLFCFSTSLLNKITKRLRNFTYEGEKYKLLLVKHGNKDPKDRTCWYSINYEALNDLLPAAHAYAERRQKEIKANIPASVLQECAEIQQQNMMDTVAVMPILNS